MSFTSLFFLFAFLPIVLVLKQFFKNTRSANLFLLAVSWIFYAWTGWQALCLLVLETTWIWLCAREKMERSKVRLWTSVGFLLAVLFLYKYVPVWLDLTTVTMPLGISFYTFTAISYLADRYQGKVPANDSFVEVGLYLAFFGKLLQGPISKYHEIEPELKERKVTKTDISVGTLLFFKGMFKKVLIAENLGVLFAGLAADSSFLAAWLAALAYSFQLYFDFSGYSDMAIGISRWFGFHIPRNFDHPYQAVSVQDFWRRWHIALSSWFRDYVYIPLGGNRVSEGRWIRNILIVWLLTGLWHGATWNFVLWGLWYAMWLVVEKKWLNRFTERWPTPVRVVCTFLIANFGWVLFANDTGTAMARLGQMFGIGTSGFAGGDGLFMLRTYAPILITAMLLSGNLGQMIMDRLMSLKQGRLVTGIVYGILILISVAAMIGSTSQTFLYFAF